MSEKFNVEEIFAEDVFTLTKMREYLPKKVFAEVKNVMENGGELSLAAADVVASTYYTVAGQEIAAPVKGINLVKQTLADGSVKTIKVIVK